MIVLVLGTSSNTHDSNDELANQHSEGAIDENGTTAESLNGVEGDWSATDIDEGGDNTDQEWVADGLQLLKESGSELSRGQRLSLTGVDGFC